ncbi:MAG: hypothetical protein ABIJ92_02445 [Candidatus Aenigmatarchaeota archaeon]
MSSFERYLNRVVSTNGNVPDVEDFLDPFYVANWEEFHIDDLPVNLDLAAVGRYIQRFMGNAKYDSHLPAFNNLEDSSLAIGFAEGPHGPFWINATLQPEYSKHPEPLAVTGNYLRVTVNIEMPEVEEPELDVVEQT